MDAIRNPVLTEKRMYSKELGERCSTWSFEQALKYYENTRLEGTKRRVRTIATSYHRLHEGGVERVLAELLRIWIEMGYQVVLFMEEPKNDYDYSYPDSVKRKQLPGYDNMKDRLCFLEKECLEEQVDVFINHNWTVLESIWECVLMKKIGIPYVQYCHGHYSWCFDYGYPFFYQPRFFKMCDMVIALSETNARFYQTCGCNTYLVNNPVPNDLKSVQSGAAMFGNHILVSGRVAEEKYPLEALQIFKLVHDRLGDTVLDIVGDGNELAKTVEYAEKLGISEHVVFHGKKNADEIKEYYKKSVCELFTSKLEGYPMMILETKAYGLPLVMYELPYLTLVKDKKGILSAPIGDIQGTADNIIRIFEDSALRERLGREARESFESFVSYDDVSEWKRIFDILEGKLTGTARNYYDPEKTPEENRFLIPVILDKTNKGFEMMINNYENSKDFKIGKAIMVIPRKLKQVFRHLMSGVSL